jgi:hypothetical protein
MDGFNYFACELRKTGDPLTTDGRSVKFRGENGETRWMTLTPQQYAQVQELMIRIDEDSYES